ncbi:glycosyltransferase family 2 protein [Nonomuraea sp. SYSU D8015]|uniref:glycosyltransferase family 2 protein n=1 Tax=Nonomuraea sp. SYSU D8015 TaxID=2593644 RepID=UPI001660948E|nr:glycosyltransferase family 2 protein [Nonomuraea sp. SYSU D8015]
MTRTGKHDLSVVIPTHRQAHCLEPVLESLARQSLPREAFEVVVVEDPSEVSYEASAKRALELGFRFEALPGRAGRSATRNHAVNLARGDVLLFLDGDCYAAPDLLEKHWRFHRDAPGPRAAAGTRLEITSLGFAGRLVRGEAISKEERDRECYDIRFPAGVPDEAARLAMETPWLYAYTNVSVPRALVTAVGCFDEQFGLQWGLEDIDLFYRIYVQMGRLPDAFVYDESMISYHLPHYRNRGSELGQFRGNEPYFRRKHAHFEVEPSVDLPDLSAYQIRLYRQRVAQFTASEAGRTDESTWRRVEKLLSTWPNVLYAGLGTADLPLPPGTITMDHGAPPSQSNEHLLGLFTGYPEGAFDVVINVDLWRLLHWQDLCTHVNEALRIADELLLIRTAQRIEIDGDPVSDDRDLEYFLRALGSHVSIITDRSESGALLIRCR